jgi:hypothetical protein
MREFRTSGSVGAPVEQSLGRPDNSETKNKTCTRVRYFFVSCAKLGFMSLSNAKFLANRA